LKARTAMVGVGAALLLLFPYYLPFFHPQNHYLYHFRLPVTNLIGGMLVVMVGLSLLLIGLLTSIQYLPSKIQRVLQALYTGLMIWSIVNDTVLVLIDLWVPARSWAEIWSRSAIAISLLLGVFACFLPGFTQWGVRAVRVFVMASAFSVVWIVPHLLQLGLARESSRSVAPNFLSAPMSGSSEQRIVWILFDELSYDQTFDHPAPGIQLPNLHRLQTRSVSFSDLKPAGYLTDRIIPSLFSGRSFNKLRSTVNGELLYWDESQRRWIVYDPNDTLFGLARRNGWNTGVDGWFNPYCRMLDPVLNVCSWEPSPPPFGTNDASKETSVLANSAALADQFLANLIGRQTDSPANVHIQDFRNVMGRTQALIDDDRVQFVFLHLPAPHPPGIYDRNRHMLQPGGSYLDNLVLADDTLGTLMQEIDATPSASHTTVIVSSDHSWRIPIWRPTPQWTAEEERASGGRFDDRPVLLIHFPGQTSENDMTSPVPELLEHDIIAGMLDGKIENPKELQNFVAQNSR
jgi:Sulfatase